ncbi:MAG: hypothetical protein WDN46_10075 [Methylocella sp.]
MRPYDCVRNDDMPAPDKIVLYSDGMFGPAMFHYATEGTDCGLIARDHGFEIKVVPMYSDLGDDHPLMKAYFEGRS